MADCGAAGTTIDRAARAVFGADQGQEAAKHVGSLMGHASVANQAAMATVAPDHVTLPGGSFQTMMASPPSMAAHNSEMQSAWQASQASNQNYSQMMHHQLHSQQQQMIHPHAMAHHHQQQQAMQQAMFQHQQLMMQQMHMMQEQQASHRTADATAVEKVIDNVEGQIPDEFEKWQEGLEEDAKRLQEDGIYDDDGIPKGATIEELAAAWAEAEAEYEQFGDLSEDPSNLWQGEMEDHVPQPYEFVNTQTPTEMLDWMEEGMKHFKNGNMKDAIRSFEMELQHNNPDNSAAWRMLGRCHAENDQDQEAITCLEAAVDRDPYSPESLLALGVSYVNELNLEGALSNMKAWCTHNPKYAGMEMPPDIYGANSSTPNPESAFEEVRQLLLSALEFDSSDAGDIYEALGVVYTVIRDYDASAESFRKALEIRPNDYQLWNKLGATLANGSQSDQALPAYHRALKIKPKYARAWLNMAISHSNLQDHNEAARCYLQTLSLNPEAGHCWTYLRMALSCSERWDLLPLVFSKDLSAFKEHFDFVLY
eukprot:scaffold2830_cov131-Cylindrotheca_fusiformis.AAC.36